MLHPDTAPPELEVTHLSPGLSMGSLGPVCIALWAGKPTPELFEIQRAGLAVAVTQRRGEALFLCVITTTSDPPDETERQAPARMITGARRRSRGLRVRDRGHGVPRRGHAHRPQRHQHARPLTGQAALLRLRRARLRLARKARPTRRDQRPRVASRARSRSRRGSASLGTLHFAIDGAYDPLVEGDEDGLADSNQPAIGSIEVEDREHDAGDQRAERDVTDDHSPASDTESVAEGSRGEEGRDDHEEQDARRDTRGLARRAAAPRGRSSRSTPRRGAP